MTGFGTKEAKLVSEASDIPWGVIGETRQLGGKSWVVPRARLDKADAYIKEVRAKGGKVELEEIYRLANACWVHLVEIRLSNGIRYVEIRDSKTDQAVFSHHELIIWRSGCTDSDRRAFEEINLGEGYNLLTMLASEDEGDGQFTASTIKKRFTAPGGHSGSVAQHEWFYQIVPQWRLFNGNYEYRRGSESIAIRMEAIPDKVKRGSTPNLSYVVTVADMETRDQADFLFGKRGGGQLEEIRLGGRGILGMEGTEPEFLAWSEETQRGVLRITGERLKDPRVGIIIRKLFGVEPSGLLVLDTKTTLDNLIQNADGESPRNPIEVLVFANARRVVDWRPFLLDEVR